MKEKSESVAYEQEEERETPRSAYQTPNVSRDPQPSDMSYFDCDEHGRVRGTSCPYGD